MHQLIETFTLAEKEQSPELSLYNVRMSGCLKLKGDRPVDRRGRGITNTLPVEIHELVKNHIKSFPLKETHYCGEKCTT